MTSIWTDARTGKLTEASLLSHLEEDPELLDSEDQSGATPLGHAIKASKPSIVQLLLSNSADPDKSSGGITPTYLAVIAASNSERLVQLLLEQDPRTLDTGVPSKNNETPLMAAVSVARNASLVRQLVRAGALLNKRNRDGRTAWDLVDLVPGDKREEIIDILLGAAKSNGADKPRRYA
ncbi:ankyrin repeat-containing domain protein [Aspergillus californicus]